MKTKEQPRICRRRCCRERCQEPKRSRAEVESTRDLHSPLCPTITEDPEGLRHRNDRGKEKKTFKATEFQGERGSERDRQTARETDRQTETRTSSRIRPGRNPRLIFCFNCSNSDRTVKVRHKIFNFTHNPIHNPNSNHTPNLNPKPKP